jgi:SAM-dependent methyltransferase
MNAKLQKLNLGCGNFPKEGYLNIDHSRWTKADLLYDLNQIPYPFPDNLFERVELSHILEHLEKPFEVMKEIHRVCRNDAILEIYVPHFSRGFTHVEHNHGYDMTFPFYFNPHFMAGYQGVEYKVEKTTLTWFSQLTLKRVHFNPLIYVSARSAGIVFDFFANLSPMICSRLWCYWVGGFEEIYFRLKVVK